MSRSYAKLNRATLSGRARPPILGARRAPDTALAPNPSDRTRLSAALDDGRSAAQSRRSPSGEAAGSTSFVRPRVSPVPGRKIEAYFHRIGGKESRASSGLPET